MSKRGPNPQTPLELVSTDELVEELKSRHKSFFLVARPHGQSEYDWRSHSGGSVLDILGMIELVKADLIRLHGEQNPPL